jgi:hypothetical protein
MRILLAVLVAVALAGEARAELACRTFAIDTSADKLNVFDGRVQEQLEAAIGGLRLTEARDPDLRIIVRSSSSGSFPSGATFGSAKIVVAIDVLPWFGARRATNLTSRTLPTDGGIRPGELSDWVQGKLPAARSAAAALVSPARDKLRTTLAEWDHGVKIETQVGAQITLSVGSESRRVAPGAELGCLPEGLSLSGKVRFSDGTEAEVPPIAAARPAAVAKVPAPMRRIVEQKGADAAPRETETRPPVVVPGPAPEGTNLTPFVVGGGVALAGIAAAVVVLARRRRRDGSSSKEAAAPREQTAGVDRTRLRNVIVERFTVEELEILCADLDQRLRTRLGADRLSLENLGGEGKPAKVLNLIEFVENRDLLDELVKMVREQRPGAL